ncbi:MAG: MlaD family protein [Myxococcota bacterium]
MELTPAQKVRLGAFLLTGAVLIGGTLVTLMGLSLFERRDSFTTRFSESVSGLEVSAPVKYRGLRVGRVDDMRIAEDDPGAIEIEFSVVPGTVLYEGTRAALDASGITGLKTINLVGGGDPSKGVIAPGSELPSDPGFMDRIVDQAENVALRVSQVADQIQRWTRDENREQVEEMIRSFNAFAGAADAFMRENTRPMSRALNGVADASEGIATLTQSGAKSLDKIASDIEAITSAVRRPLERVNPTDLARTLTATRNAMESLNERLAAGETGSAIANLSTTLSRLTTLIDDLDLAVRAGREDFTASLSYIRQAAEDLREFSRIIAQDPSTLVRGRE